MSHLPPPPPSGPPPSGPPPGWKPPHGSGPSEQPTQVRPAWNPAAGAPAAPPPPPAGPPSGPPGFPPSPPGYSPYGAGPPPQPPRRTNTALVVVGAIAAVIVLGLIGAGLVVLFDRGDDGTDTATDRDNEQTSQTSEPSEPTESSEPTEPETSEPPPSPTLPTPTETPDPEPSDPESSPNLPTLGNEPVSYKEFDGDLEFKLDDVELNGKFVSGVDYDTCAPAEGGNELTKRGCIRASEWTYRSLKGRLALTHVIYTFDGPKTADKVASNIKEEWWKVRDESLLAGRPGIWKTKAAGQFVVLSVVTHETDVKEKVVSKYLHYGNTDIYGALLFRF